MDRPPLTPLQAARAGGRTLPRSGSRGSISSVASTGKLRSRGDRGRFHTWNPAAARGKSPLPRAQSALRLERKGSARSLMSSGSSNVGAAPSVRVMVRVRPFLSDGPEAEDEQLDERACLQVVEDEVRLGGDGGQVFTFDRVFGEQDGQEEVFRDAGKPIAENALAGFNASIFAYGQTGSGKTYTMQGRPEDEALRGLLPRVLEYCFVGLDKLRARGAVVVAHCSFLEIYNEQVYDLLEEVSRSERMQPGYEQAAKAIREDMKRGVFVEGAVEQSVASAEEAVALVSRGARNRHVSSTDMNRESSRSHAIFTLVLAVRLPASEGGAESTQQSRVNLVDLAGSERQRATQAVGERLAESKHINKSLSALGNVISSLVERSKGRKQHHIPHRDSALTYLLRDSLGGNTKTSIIATVSPDAANFQDTLSTLQFGQRAKRVRNVVKANLTQASDVPALRREIKRLREELGKQQQQQQTPLTSRPGSAASSGSEGPPPLSAELLANPDFSQLDEKVARGSAQVQGGASGQRVLRQRLTHLEQVLVHLLRKLSDDRDLIDNLKVELGHRKDLEEKLRSNVSAQTMLLQLSEQQHQQRNLEVDASEMDAQLRDALAARDKAQVAAQAERVKHAKLESELHRLMAANAELATLYQLKESGEDDDEAVRRSSALLMQLEAVIEDKVELERLVKGLGEEKAKLEAALASATAAAAAAKAEAEEEEEELLEFEAGSGALRQQLTAANAKVSSLEEELYRALESHAASNPRGRPAAAEAPGRLSSSGSGGRRRFSDEYDMGRSKRASVLLEESSGETTANAGTAMMPPSVDSPSAAARPFLTVAAEVQRSARKMMHRAEQREREAELLAARAASSAPVVAPSSPAQEEGYRVVRQRLLMRIKEKNRQLAEQEQELARLRACLKSKESERKSMRKSLTAKDNEEDMKRFRLERELSNLRAQYQQLENTNRVLIEAGEAAQMTIQWKEKQIQRRDEELRKGLQPKENRPRSSNNSSSSRSSSKPPPSTPSKQPQQQPRLPLSASARDKLMRNERRDSTGTEATIRSELEGDGRESTGSGGSTVSGESVRRTVSVAAFFPDSGDTKAAKEAAAQQLERLEQEQRQRRQSESSPAVPPRLYAEAEETAVARSSVGGAASERLSRRGKSGFGRKASFRGLQSLFPPGVFGSRKQQQ